MQILKNNLLFPLSIKLKITLESFCRQVLLDDYVLNTHYCVLWEDMDAVIKDVSNKCKYLKMDFSHFNFAYLFATIKFHKKNPIQFRFVNM